MAAPKTPLPFKRPLVLSTPLTRGDDVLVLQTRLHDWGVYNGELDSEFGPVTAAACRTWKWRHGVPKKQCTADCGPRLWEWVVNAHPISAAMRTTAARRAKAAREAAAANRFTVARLLAVAQKEADAHVHEDPPGSNGGPRVHEYQATTGALDQAWCLSFVRWCFLKAGYAGAWCDLPAYCPSMASFASSGEGSWTVVGRASGRPGDVPLYDFGSGTWQHTGILKSKIRQDGTYATIEGNTSVNGSQDAGGAVLERVRDQWTIRTLARPPVAAL